jgi:hypothetical protein
VEGVTKLSAAELENQRFDCVIAFNILEHVSSPLEEMHRIAALLNPGGTLIVSVPEEYPKFLPGYDLSARAMRFFSTRIPLVAMGVALFSGVIRSKFNIFPPLSLVFQHEHINFFTPESLILLAKQESCKVLSLEFEREPAGIFRRSLILVCQYEPIII